MLTKAEEVSPRLRVTRLEDQPLSSLSGGERKRVALAAALVREPGERGAFVLRCFDR